MIILKKLKIAIILSLFIISFTDVILSNAVIFEGKIQKNIYIRDINISNLTKEEAKEKINKNLSTYNSFSLKLNEDEYIFKNKDIDVDYNVDEIVEKAYEIGRNEGFITNIKTRSNLHLGKKIILDYSITFDEKKLNKYLNDLNKKIYVKPINATIKIDNGKIDISKEKNGYKLNKDELKNTIIRKIKLIDNSEENIPIIIVKPIYTYEKLSKINYVLGRFETYFNSKNYDRVNNIKLASDATSNILLNEGEVFSFNTIIKNANIDNYLKEAPVIINGKQDRGKGGGMCQVSSTIYNSALYSGMKIVSVKNHSIPSPYIEKGRDATVSGGCIDLKFINKYDTPVFIYNEVKDNKIVCTIYGNVEDKKDIEIVTETSEILSNKIVRKNSEEYDLGMRKIEQEGRKGYKVKTYRIYKSSLGQKTEYIGESYYPPQDKVIIYGTREISK